jgi:hypothetical protein
MAFGFFTLPYILSNTNFCEIRVGPQNPKADNGKTWLQMINEVVPQWELPSPCYMLVILAMDCTGVCELWIFDVVGLLQVWGCNGVSSAKFLFYSVLI